MPSSKIEFQSHEEYDFKWSVIAFWGTLVSVFLAFDFITFRLGLYTPLSTVVSAIVVLAAAFFTPMLLPNIVILRNMEIRMLTYPLISLLVFSSVLLSFVVGNHLILLYFFLALSGMVKAFRFLKFLGARELVYLLVLAIFVSLYLFIIVNNQGYAGVYAPELAMLGMVHHDVSFHTAIAHLIQNFGIPSLGYNGMPPIHYHFGSHYWLAAFGVLAGNDPIWSYAVVVVILVGPTLLLSFFLSSIAIKKSQRSVVSIVFLGSLLLFISDSIGWSDYYISESYTFGLIGMLLLLPLLANFATTHIVTKFEYAKLFLLLISIPMLMALKVSVGLLWGVGICWIAVRRYGVNIVTLLIVTVTLFFASYGIIKFSPSTGDYVNKTESVIYPLYLFIKYPVPALACLVFPLILVYLTLRKKRVSFQKTFQLRDNLLVEVVVVMTLVGAVPGLTGVPQDSATWYFLNVGQWVALPLLLGSAMPLDFLRNHLINNRFFIFLLVILSCLSFAKLLYPRFLGQAKNIVSLSSRQGGDYLIGTDARQYIKQSILTEHVIFGEEVSKALALSIGARLISVVRAASPYPQFSFAVFIPPENIAFWNFQPLCNGKHNVQVSLTGQPSFLGAPPASYNCQPDVYQTNTQSRIDSHTLTDVAICEEAKKINVDNVLKILSLYNYSSNYIIKCASN